MLDVAVHNRADKKSEQFLTAVFIIGLVIRVPIP